MTKKYDVALLGATGLVGEAVLEALSARQLPIRNLYALASEKSAGARVSFGDDEVTVLDAAGFDFTRAQICLFCAGGEAAEMYAARATAAGSVVVDCSGRFRLERGVPLVVPEANPESVAGFSSRHILSSPGCVAVELAVALKPLYDSVGIERIVVATYQPVSEAGRAGVEELAEQTLAIFNQRSLESAVFAKQMAFNVLPLLEGLEEEGQGRSETALASELQKIFADDDLRLDATMVRVPVFFGCSMAVHIETRREIDAADARTLLEDAPGVVVYDEREEGGYPTPALEAAGNDPVFVGRLRKDPSNPLGLNLWVVADNVRKGAALNMVQIAEILIEKYLA